MPGATNEPMKAPEPPTVLYRGIEVHNPLYEGGMTVWQYGKNDIKTDCKRITDKDSESDCALRFDIFFLPILFDFQSHAPIFL
jgi:hypothetical protein